MINPNLRLRALCVGRHPFLSDHFARFFAGLGIETEPAVGLDAALAASRTFHPDVVVCEYELLASLPLDAWEKDELLCRMPVIAISLTRRPNEAQILDANGVGGFLYLPTLKGESAARIISAAAGAARNGYVPAPVGSSMIHEAEPAL